MAREVITKQTFIGFSTEEKPAGKIAVDAVYFEYDDTEKVIRKYKFNGIEWILFQVNTYTGGTVVSVEGNRTLLQDNFTCDGTAHPLAAEATPCKVITIQANPDNTGKIYIGIDEDTDADNHMFVLSAGEYIPFTISDLSKLYYFGAASDKLSYGGEV